jgi:hypothetical protein
MEENRTLSIGYETFVIKFFKGKGCLSKLILLYENYNKAKMLIITNQMHPDLDFRD